MSRFCVAAGCAAWLGHSVQGLHTQPLTSSTADNHKGLSPILGKQSTTVLTSSWHDGLLCSWRLQSAVLESEGISGG